MASVKQKTLRLILGDQLNIKHSWYTKVDESVTYVLMEIRSETDYAKHHIQKVLGFFGAMQQFAQTLKQQKHNVIYIHLNDKNNTHSFAQNCSWLISTHGFTHFEYQLPDEYRVDEHLKQFADTLTISAKVFDTEHFFSKRDELKELFDGKKSYLMETFYRHMRKKHDVLIEDNGKPLMGKWNFDEDNRQKLPKAHKPVSPKLFQNDLSNIEKEITKAGVTTIGKVDSAHFLWPINREQSLELLEFFVAHCIHLYTVDVDSQTVLVAKGTLGETLSTEGW
jgi:deoxyribodipyrimidine photolyase-related protein